MSDVVQQQGWWIASDGKWYPPELHPDYAPPTPLAIPDPLVGVGGGSATEESVEHSTVEECTVRKCVKGDEMPDSQTFCSVSGGGHSEALPDFASSTSNERTGFLARKFKGVPVVLILAVATLSMLGLSVEAFSGSGSTASPSPSHGNSNTPSTSAPAPVTQPDATVGTVTVGEEVAAGVSRQENIFLLALADPSGTVAGAFNNVSVADAWVAGVATCAYFEGGDTTQQVLNHDDTLGTTWGLGQEDMGYFVGRSVVDICPQYESNIRTYMGDPNWPGDVTN